MNTPEILEQKSSIAEYFEKLKFSETMATNLLEHCSSYKPPSTINKTESKFETTVNIRNKIIG